MTSPNSARRFFAVLVGLAAIAWLPFGAARCSPAEQPARAGCSVELSPRGFRVAPPFVVVPPTYSSDGERLLCASADGTVTIWDTRSRAVSARFHAHTVRDDDAKPSLVEVIQRHLELADGADIASTLVWSRTTGSVITVASGSIFVWSERGQLLRTIPGGPPVGALAFAETDDGSAVVSWPDGTLGVASLSHGEELTLVSTRGSGAVWLDAHSRRDVVVLRETGRVEVFDEAAHTVRQVTMLDKSERWLGVTSTPTELIVLGERSGRAVLVNLRDGSQSDLPAARLPGEETPLWCGVVTATPGRAFIWRRNTVFEWDVASGRVRQIVDDTGAAVVAMAARPGGAEVTVLLESGVLRTWDLTTGREIGEPSSHVGPIRSAALAVDGNVTWTVGGEGDLRRWALGERCELVDATLVEREVRDLVHVRRAAIIVHRTVAGRLTVRDHDSGAVQFSIEAPAGDVRGLAVDAAGTRVFLSFSDARVWTHRLESSDRSGRWSESGGGMGGHISASRDAALLAQVVSGTRVRVRDAESLEILHEFTPEPDANTGLIKGVSFGIQSIDTLFVLAGGDLTSWRITPQSAVEMTRTQLGSGPRCFDVALSGELAAVGYDDGTVRRIGLDGSEPQLVGKRHHGAVLRVCLDRSADRIVSGGVDARVIVWKLGRSARDGDGQ